MSLLTKGFYTLYTHMIKQRRKVLGNKPPKKDVTQKNKWNWCIVRMWSIGVSHYCIGAVSLANQNWLKSAISDVTFPVSRIIKQCSSPNICFCILLQPSDLRTCENDRRISRTGRCSRTLQRLGTRRSGSLIHSLNNHRNHPTSLQIKRSMSDICQDRTYSPWMRSNTDINALLNLPNPIQHSS